MHTPAADYVQFWLLLFGSGALLLCTWPWLFCAIVALGGMKHRTWRRVLYALALGPFALGDVMSRRW